MTVNNKYKVIIGLEVHIEPNTKSKMFCKCPQDHFAKKPNINTCPICLGLPGALPIANKVAIDKTIKLGLALGSKISQIARFDRKHYFYPDLPKSFQTSQKDNPFCVGGQLLGKKINHIHLEEDAGKLIHESGNSLVDFNRSGCALIELVTEPVFYSVEEVITFLKELQLVARYIDISSADMEKGTMRLEANISLSRDGSLPNYKVELKNINSFRFLEKALRAEIQRQALSLDKGEKLEQETRGYDEKTGKTFSQRSKADSQDYRYFPEADLPPIKVDDSTINDLQLSIPELPQAKRERFEKEYKISKEFIEILVSDKNRADYYEKASKLDNNYKTIADLMVNKKMDLKYPEPSGLVRIIKEMENKTYESEENTQTVVDKVLQDNPEIVVKYNNGQTQVIGFLIGQVQKHLQGKGDPKLISRLIVSKLE